MANLQAELFKTHADLMDKMEAYLDMADSYTDHATVMMALKLAGVCGDAALKVRNEGLELLMSA